MTSSHPLAEKRFFTIFNLAAIAVLTGITASAQAAPPQADVSTTLARAEAAYYEARFNDTIDILTPLNARLEGQPAQVRELIRTKLQLALAHIGLNQLLQAKTLFSELQQLDPQFSLDQAKFAPKVLALFEEARAMRHDPPKNVSAADVLYEEAVQAYQRGDLAEAQNKIQSVLALNPQHRLAAEYVSVINKRVRLSIEQLTLKWTQACGAHDQPTVDTIRKQLSELSETAITQDILNQMNSCAAKPAPVVQTAVVSQVEPERRQGCLENSSAVALLRLKTRVEPRLPAELRNKRNVRVHVSVKIDEGGNTRVYQVRSESMPLTRAVVAAVDQWKFYPATNNDRPACVETEFPVQVNR
jgi:tetratricopeptide (TPR) repeat protein